MFPASVSVRHLLCVGIWLLAVDGTGTLRAQPSAPVPRVVLSGMVWDEATGQAQVRTQLTNTDLFAAPPANVRTNVQPVQPGRQVTGYFAGHPVRQATVECGECPYGSGDANKLPKALFTTLFLT